MKNVFKKVRIDYIANQNINRISVGTFDIVHFSGLFFNRLNYLKNKIRKNYVISMYIYIYISWLI